MLVYVPVITGSGIYLSLPVLDLLWYFVCLWMAVKLKAKGSLKTFCLDIF